MFKNTPDFDLDDEDLLAKLFPPIFPPDECSTQECPETNAETATTSLKVSQDPQKDEDHVKKKTISTMSKITTGLPSKETLKRCSWLNLSPRVVKRKFPGPAGLFLDKTDIIEPSSKDPSDDSVDDFFLCSQRTMSTYFEDGPWKQMTEDLFVNGGTALYEQFNIAWLKERTKLKLFKAPFLAAVIQNLDVTDGRVPTVNVTLQDPTGTIHGTMLHSLYEEKADYLTAGSVVILKMFGVLSSDNNYCLTVTPNNLLTIYSLRTIKSGYIDRSSTQKIILQEFSLDNILEEYGEYLQATKEHCYAKVNTVNNVQVRAIIRPNKITEPNPSANNQTCSDTTIANASLSRPVNTSRVRESNEPQVKKLCQSKGNQSNTNKDVVVRCSQVSVQTDVEYKEIWKDLFEDVDIKSLFDDF